MPFKDPNKKQEYLKEYHLKNREQIKEYQKEYQQKNKEQLLEYQKEYNEKNREKIKEYKKEYRKEYIKTPQGKKSMRITQWKKRGIIFFDYNFLYEIYINTEYCDLCNIKLTTDRFTTLTTRCLDHDHNINDCDNVRNILCHSCNTKRG